MHRECKAYNRISGFFQAIFYQPVSIVQKNEPRLYARGSSTQAIELRQDVALGYNNQKYCFTWSACLMRQQFLQSDEDEVMDTHEERSDGAGFNTSEINDIGGQSCCFSSSILHFLFRLGLTRRHLKDRHSSFCCLHGQQFQGREFFDIVLAEYGAFWHLTF